MRSQILIGGVASIGLLLAVAACSDGTTDAGPGSEDAGSSGSSGKSSSSSGSSGTDPDDEKDAGKKKDAGSSSGGPTLSSDTLAQGDQQLLAIAGDDAIYFDFGQTTTLYAVPIAGSVAPTKIADIGDNDDLLVNGGAVAVWTNIDAKGFGTLNVWTRATGLKTNVATGSGSGAFFRASEDGSRIAFTQNLAVDGSNKLVSLEVGVRDTSATTNAATLSGTTAAGNAFNYASAAGDCAPSMGFAGKVFFAQFCTGTDANAKDAKLVTVAANGTQVVRLDAAANNAAGTLKGTSSFVPSEDGTKLYVESKTGAGLFITVGTAGGTLIENNVAEGFMLPDGSAVIYRTTGNVLKKATTATPPVPTTLAAADAKGLLGISPDGKNILFHKLDPQGDFDLVDVNIVDHTAATPSAVALVPTNTALPIGVNGANSHFVFATDITETGAKLSSIAIAGGAAKTLGDTLGAILAPAGTGALSITNVEEEPDGQFTISDLTHYDTVTGKSSKVADSVPDGEIQVKAKRVVYTRYAAQGSGVYAVTLP